MRRTSSPLAHSGFGDALTSGLQFARQGWPFKVANIVAKLALAPPPGRRVGWQNWSSEL